MPNTARNQSGFIKIITLLLIIAALFFGYRAWQDMNNKIEAIPADATKIPRQL